MTSKRKINPDHYVVTADAEVSDIDLDREPIQHRGKRLTEADAERLAEQTLANIRAGKPSLEQIRRGRGRPSLSGASQHSPQVAFRVPPQLRKRAEEQAAKEGRQLSDLVRAALEEYLTRHGQ